MAVVQGGVGGNGTATVGGDGGIGSSAHSDWGLVTGTGENVSGTIYYAGGGGGGTYEGGTGGAGGAGGGGRGNYGQTNINNTSGLPTTGGGAGGSGRNAALANTTPSLGGSGIVIIRYAN